MKKTAKKNEKNSTNAQRRASDWRRVLPSKIDKNRPKNTEK